MKSVINSSSLFILISWSLLLSHCVVVCSTLNTEGEALLSLLNNKFSFENFGSVKLDWKNLSSSNISPCDWVGIGCNTQNTHVVSLNLFGYLISGQLGPQIGQLSYLKSLDLRDNRFNGPIPLELWDCSRLQHLDLSSNHFNGEFPHEAMRNLHQLKTFSINSNQFSGRIPEYLFQNSGLEDVDFHVNNLTGSIPVNIGNATNMKKLDLSDNQLHGTIPSSIGNCMKLENLWLGNNGLSGELPVEMTKLRLLKKITLNGNKFFGSVPKDLGTNNTNLEEVDFSNNAFTGEIPPNLCFGQKLVSITFYQNQFQGNIPSSYTLNCASLTYLTLQGNKLTGTLPDFAQINNPSDPIINQNGEPRGMKSLDFSRNKIHGHIPSSICTLIYLVQLDLSKNQMNGTLPHCLGDLNQLYSLNLRSNNFSGTVPMNFSTDSLVILDLNGNHFEGKIPRSLGVNSPKLSILDLGNNQFNDTFHSFLETLELEVIPNLMILVLRSNKFYGPLKHLHSRYLPFSGLRILDISNNYFTGNLPLEFILGLDAMKNIDDNGDYDEDWHYFPMISTVIIHKGQKMSLNNTMLVTFRAIDMSNNRFQGSIPESIGELLVLMSLNLSNNNLNGHIPSSLGNLTPLESLDLSENKLFGEIPGQLTKLNFLAVLNLSHNNLRGHIPTARQFLTYPNSSFDGNPGLCGLQSSTGCVGSHHQDPVVEKESYEDSNSWNFGWEPVVIGYGCGVLIGLVIQYFIFTKASMYRWFG